MVFSSPFDPKNSRGSLDPHAHSRQSSIYEAQPTKRYSYQDSSRGSVSATHYTVRPRTNSAVQSDSRPPLSMLVQNRNHPVVSNSARDDYRGSVVVPSSRNESSRYLVPAASHGHQHHQRHYSATRAEIDRLPLASRSGGGSMKPRPEYHNAGGYNVSPYTSSRVKDGDFSYTGPREQFARDYPSRPPNRRESVTRRERPASVYEITGYKDGTSGRRDLTPLAPPPAAATRQLDRLDRGDGGRVNGRAAYESEPERGSELVHRRHSVRVPVVHQTRQDDARDYSHRDDYEPRPRIRRDRVEDDLPTRPRVERVSVDDGQPRPRKERADDDLPVRYKKDRFDDDGPSRPRKERYLDNEPTPRPRREHAMDADLSPKPRSLEAERDIIARDRVRERDQKRSDDGRGSRSRDSSPVSGHGKAVATGLGGLAVAGLASTALKSSQKSDDILDDDGRKEKKHRRHRHHDDDDDRGLRDQGSASDRKLPIDADERPEERRRSIRRDDSETESLDGGREQQQQQRQRRHKHRDREQADIEAAPQATRGVQDSGRPDGTPFKDDGPSRRQRRASRAREDDSHDLERRTLSPGDDDDGRPRRVQLVDQPLKEKEEFKPKGILKAPRTVPFPEDPNPCREGVAPLKDTSKDGVPANARWTKINRVLVNPEALEKAQERFEERDGYVVVLRVLNADEIQKLADKTREIRANREREWEEELERQRAKESTNPPQHSTAGPGDEEVHQQTLPLLDQVPANPSVDIRVFTDPDNVPAPAAPSAVPVPDIKLEKVETANYRPNV
ncbi:hypothetical protein DV737_g3864, partial [Chaetothyriales sp. CBS 132003]